MQNNKDLKQNIPENEEKKKSFLDTSRGKFFVSVAVTITLFICVIVAAVYVFQTPQRITDPEILATRTTEKLRWFEFQLEGEPYQVPSEWILFEENGWVLEDNPILSDGEKRVLYANKENFRIQVTLTNDLPELQNANKCTVTQIVIKANEDESKNPAFFAVHGLTLRKSYDDMKEALGDYDHGTIRNSMYSYLYQYGKTAAIQISLDEVNGISEIILNRIVK